MYFRLKKKKRKKADVVPVISYCIYNLTFYLVDAPTTTVLSQYKGFPARHFVWNWSYFRAGGDKKPKKKKKRPRMRTCIFFFKALPLSDYAGTGLRVGLKQKHARYSRQIAVVCVCVWRIISADVIWWLKLI